MRDLPSPAGGSSNPRCKSTTLGSSAMIDQPWNLPLPRKKNSPRPRAPARSKRRGQRSPNPAGGAPAPARPVGQCRPLSARRAQAPACGTGKKDEGVGSHAPGGRVAGRALRTFVSIILRRGSRRVGARRGIVDRAARVKGRALAFDGERFPAVGKRGGILVDREYLRATGDFAHAL